MEFVQAQQKKRGDGGRTGGGWREGRSGWSAVGSGSTGELSHASGDAAARCEQRDRSRRETPGRRLGNRAIDTRGDESAAEAASAIRDAAAGEPLSSWHEDWLERLKCWYLGLPQPMQGGLSSCVGALGLHFGSRLQSVVGGGASQKKSLEALAEPGCEWIEELTFVEFPKLPNLPIGEMSNFELPPLPGRWLLPEAWWQHMQSSAGRGQSGGVGWRGELTFGLESLDQPQPPPTLQFAASAAWSPTPMIAAGFAGAAGVLITFALGFRMGQAHSLRRCRRQVGGAG